MNISETKSVTAGDRLNRSDPGCDWIWRRLLLAEKFKRHRRNVLLTLFLSGLGARFHRAASIR